MPSKGDPDVYGVSRMTRGDDRNHVVTIHIPNEARGDGSEMKKALHGSAFGWVSGLLVRSKGPDTQKHLYRITDADGQPADDATPTISLIQLLPAAFSKASIPSGARWITVHPHGDGEKGVPVLIQETQRGSGVYHVVGGAGGKLNYLKLRGVKHPDEYAKDVREKQAARRDAKKEQRRQEKETGVHEQRQAERAAIDATRSEQEKAFIQEVAQSVGWDAADMALPADQLEGLSDEARRAAELKHHRQLLSKARETADLQRRALALDADARAARELGEYEAEEPGKRGMGYAPAYGERTADQAADIADEAGKIDAARRTDDDRSRSASTKERAAKIKGELDAVTMRASELKAKVLDTAKAIKVLQAAKKLRNAQKAAAEAKRAVDRGESKAYVIKVGDEPDAADIQRDIENDVRTSRTRAFLGEVGKIDSYEDALGRHLGVGAHNGLNAVSLATAGIGIIDRDAVDVLGIAGAAQAMAARLRTDLSPEQMQQATDALEQYHVDHYMQRSEEALREAAELEDAAREIDAGENADGHDLAEAHELHAQRQQALGEARRVLGVALGEMEAHAALLTAMQGNKTQALNLPLGRMATEDAVRRLRAIGLERGDYEIQHAGAEVIARITPDGMLRVAKPIDREHMDRMRTSLDIIEGRRDEADFWPKGVANRPDLALPDAPELRPDPLAEPFEAGPDLAQSLREHIGSRMADGHAIADIVQDLHTQAMAEKAGDRQADYFRALADVVPLKNDGKLIENEDRRAAFTKMADDWAQARGGRFAPLHAQEFSTDKHSIEALHRAFADEPTGTVAFKPVGDLDAQDQTALRRYFEQNIAHEDASVADKRKELDAHGTAEPERESDDMFGRGTNPAWTAWKQHGDELRQHIADRGLNWQKYVQVMGGPAAAYGAIQDHVRGRVVQKFAETHNRLNPDKPLRVGRTVLQNNLRHLDAVDPAARDKRLQQQRELVDGLRSRDAGRYAAGSVTDKLDASRERQAALEQSQLGFFAASDEQATPERPLAPDERHTIGAAGERRLAQMAQLVGQNFKPGQPVRVWQPSMTGKFVAQQRAIKLIDANKRVLLAQGVGSGKAQPLDARILTPTGWARMGDIAVGDSVIAGDGSVTKVTGVFPQGMRPVFRVAAADGGVTECCDEHLWMTTTEPERKRIAKGHAVAGSVKTLRDIRNTLVHRGRIRNHHIPVMEAAALPERPLPVAPYLLGALLGGGHLALNAIKLCSPDAEIIERVRQALPEGVDIRSDGPCDHSLTCRRRGGFNPLLDQFRQLGLAGLKSHEKFVPAIYLFNSAENRLELLRGLMDTDGCAESSGVQITFSSSSNRMAEAVEFLCRSLGGIATRRQKRPIYTYDGQRREGRISYTVCLRLPPTVNPFHLSRKAAAVVPKTKYAPRSRVIVGVVPVGVKPVQCIAVDHPSRLYVTDDFMVTHNTSMGLGAFAHVQQQGKAKRGMFIVPSIVQGQFGAEASAMLEPGKFKWHAEPGASRAERLAAYRDPKTHFNVVTHQAFRDDMIHLGARRAGINEAQMTERVRAMSPDERQKWAAETMQHGGIDHDYFMVDEGDTLLNRAGKEDSTLASVADAATANVPYYVSASADPIRNDTSEIFDVLRKMDPKRYTDRGAFMRKYGVDTQSAKDALRREMAPYLFPGRISPGVQVKRNTTPVELSAAQHAEIEKVEQHVADIRMARLDGKANVEAARALSPHSFDGADPAEHDAIAQRLAESIGVLRDTAIDRAINSHPESAKLDAVDQHVKARPGKPGVIFARSLDAVNRIAERLKAQGHRVVTITGKDSARQKAEKRLKFKPEKGDPQADILIASDAGAVGMNAQRGQWLLQYDTPQTARTHAQRNGRIERIGQKNPEIELTDLVANHEAERRARKRLKTKYGLRDIVTSPLDGLDDTGFAAYLSKARAVTAAQTEPDREAA